MRRRPGVTLPHARCPMRFAEAPQPIVVLEGVDCPPCLRAPGSYATHRAGTLLQAAIVVTRVNPTWILIRPDMAWHCAFVEVLPPRKRPAVVAVGGRGTRASFVDEWLASPSAPEEVRERLRLARERARDRRQWSRRTLTDPVTRLANRRGVARALILEAWHARRSGGQVGLVLLSVDGVDDVHDTPSQVGYERFVRRAGAALRSVARCTETCGRIASDRFALVLAGELREADRPANRCVEALQAAGVSAVGAVGILEPREPLLHLYRRTVELLRAAKQRERPPERTQTTDLQFLHLSNAGT
jgi:GGDEF domain-containing protein